MELKTLGDHVRRWRLDLCLLQKDAANRIGADVCSVYNWENGRAAPELQFLPGIIAFLGYDPRPEPSSLAERIVWFREGRGWSQKRFAKILGVDPTALARWERGTWRPVSECRLKLAIKRGRSSGGDAQVCANEGKGLDAPRPRR